MQSEQDISNMSKKEKLFSSKRFFPLFSTMFLGAFNDNVFKNALVITITYRNLKILGLESQSIVILSGAIFILPFFLLSPIAGEIAQKYPKHRMAIITKISELTIMLLALLGFYTDSFAFLLLVLFLMGAQSAFFGPLKYGMIPELIPEQEVLKANAYFSGGTFLSILIGTICGGLLASSGGGEILGIVLVGGALIGLLCSFFIPHLKVITATTSKNSNDSNEKNINLSFSRLFKSIAQNFKLVRSLPEAKELINSISWYWAVGALILALIPVIVKDTLGANSEVATFFLALFTVGMGAGSLFFERLMSDGPDRGLSIWCLVGLNLCLLSLCFLIAPESHATAQTLSEFLEGGQHLFIAFLFFLLAFFGGGYIVPLYSLLQIKFKGPQLSLLIAGNNIYNAFFMVVASLVSTLIMGLGGGIDTVMFALSGVLFIVIFKQYLTNIYDFYRTTFRETIGRFYCVEFENTDLIPKERAFIMISNHVSYIDWVFLIMASPRHINFVIDHNFYYHPLLNWFFKQVGLVPIAKRSESEKILNKAFGEILSRIDKGESIAIFPEGQLSRDGKLKRFQPGVQKILRDRKIPVVTASIHGLWGSWFGYGSGSVFGFIPNPFKKRKIKVKIVELVEASEYCPKQAHQKVLDNIEYG